MHNSNITLTGNFAPVADMSLWIQTLDLHFWADSASFLTCSCHSCYRNVHNSSYLYICGWKFANEWFKTGEILKQMKLLDVPKEAGRTSVVGNGPAVLLCEKPVAEPSHVAVLLPHSHVSSAGEFVIIPQDFRQELWCVHTDVVRGASVYGPVELLLIDLIVGDKTNPR